MDSNPDIKICLQPECADKIKAPGSNRTNMQIHLREKHKIFIHKLKASENQKIYQFKTDILDSRNIEVVIAKMVCLDFISPYAIYSKDSFKILFEKAYNQSVNEDKLWKSVDLVYEVLKDRTLEKIQNSRESPTITLDDWGCKNGKEFCNINAYITENVKDSDNNQQSTVTRLSLGVVEVPKTDSISLSKVIKEKLDMFNVKPVFITTDGAANMKKMVTISGYEQQQCYLHAINLFVVDIIYKRRTLLDPEPDSESEFDDLSNEEDDEPFEEIACNDEMSEIIKSVRKMMIKLSRSKKLRYELRKYTDLAPIVDVKTRWNSMCLMLERTLQIFTPIRQAALICSDMLLISEFLKENVIAKIERLLNILQPVKHAVQSLSAEDNNLLSSDIILSNCYKDINKIAPEVARQFFERIQSRRTICSDVLAMFLGNKTKNLFYSEPIDSEIMELHDKIISLTTKVNQPSIPSPSTSDIESAKRPKYTVVSSSDFELEIDSFRRKKFIGPKIDVVLKSLLAIKPTSIDSERAFSVCRNIMKFNRVRTGSEKLDKMLFVNQNFNKLA